MGSALLGAAGIALFIEADETAMPTHPTDSAASSAMSSHPAKPEWRRLQFGHDWIESVPKAVESQSNDEGGLARALLRPGSMPSSLRTKLLSNTECRDPGCRTCQWMQLFGGEW